MGQTESQIDVIAAHHGQGQGHERGFPGDVIQGVLQVLGLSAGKDEPQVDVMLAFIVVIDLGQGADAARDVVQAGCGHVHPDQGAAETGRVQYGAYAAQHSVLLPLLKVVQDGLLA